MTTAHQVFRLAIAAAAFTCAPAAAYYDGYLDGANCEIIRGWAWDSTLPNTPLEVDLYDGNVRFTTVLADVFRQDLLNAGKGNGAHGFDVPIPSALRDGFAHSITARIKGVNWTLQWSPRTLTCGMYAPYYSEVFTSINAPSWTQNGTVAPTYNGLSSSSVNGGSLISTVPIPDGTNDHEVRIALYIPLSGGTFVSYLRASSNALSGPSPAGSYYSVELQSPSRSGGGCSFHAGAV